MWTCTIGTKAMVKISPDGGLVIELVTNICGPEINNPRRCPQGLVGEFHGMVK